MSLNDQWMKLRSSSRASVVAVRAFFAVFVLLFFALTLSAEAAVLDEWKFGLDTDGTSLNQALNSGTNSPPARFAAGFDSTVFTALLGCAFFRGFFSWIDSADHRSSSAGIFRRDSRRLAG